MIDYIELHARSAFSFLRGAATPEELIAVCSELKMPAMALLDNDGVYGAARFHLAAQKLKIKAHIEAEITVSGSASQFKIQSSRSQISNSRFKNQDSQFKNHNSTFTLPLLVRNRTGYQNLCRLITLMKLRVPKHAKPGECSVRIEELAEYSKGLVCLTGAEDVSEARPSGRAGNDSQPLLTHRLLTQQAEKLMDIFGRDNVYAELQRHFNRHEEARNHAVIEIARRLKLPLLATNGV